MRGFERHKWWVVTALVTTPLIALAAGVPHTFSSGASISSTQVNANFKDLSDRVTTLENQRPLTATVVFSNEPNGIGKTRAFTSSGGPLVIIVSGMAHSSVGGTPLDVSVQLDGNTIGHLLGHTNESHSHKTLPTQILRVPSAASGSHTIGFTAGGAATKTDDNDYFNATVLELPR